MRTLASVLALVLVFAFLRPVTAQQNGPPLDLKVEPLAYAFGGAGGHVGLRVGDWSYTIEGFGLDVPQSLHGNEAFEASLRGAELHVEHIFGDDLQGFYAGPEVGVVRREVTHAASGKARQNTLYSLGVRGGYRWFPGLGNLYVSPVIGVSYTLNGKAVDLEGDTFETGPIGPWGTVGIGWSFSR